MNTSTGDITKARRRRPEQTGTPVLVRLQPHQLALLDAFIALSQKAVSRPEAVRMILDEYLTEIQRKDAK
jgi:hypothetical protein